MKSSHPDVDDFDSLSDISTETKSDAGDSDVGEQSDTGNLSGNLDRRRKSAKLDGISGIVDLQKARAKNREHAKNTRARKKNYVEALKETMKAIADEREKLDRDRRSTLSKLAEQTMFRKQMLHTMFYYRAIGELSRDVWAAILDENCYFIIPITPYRSFAPSQVLDGQRVVPGIDGMIADTASLAALTQAINQSRGDGKQVRIQFYSEAGDGIMSKDSFMCKWMMKTENAMELGARQEIFKQGFVNAIFSPASNKILSLEFSFDVMSFMQQLRRASGRYDFQVIPNTVAMALEESSECRIIFAVDSRDDSAGTAVEMDATTANEKKDPTVKVESLSRQTERLSHQSSPADHGLKFSITHANKPLYECLYPHNMSANDTVVGKSFFRLAGYCTPAEEKTLLELASCMKRCIPGTGIVCFELGAATVSDSSSCVETMSGSSSDEGFRSDTEQEHTRWSKSMKTSQFNAMTAESGEVARVRSTSGPAGGSVGKRAYSALRSTTESSSPRNASRKNILRAFVRMYPLYANNTTTHFLMVVEPITQIPPQDNGRPPVIQFLSSASLHAISSDAFSKLPPANIHAQSYMAPSQSILLRNPHEILCTSKSSDSPGSALSLGRSGPPHTASVKGRDVVGDVTQSVVVQCPSTSHPHTHLLAGTPLQLARTKPLGASASEAATSSNATGVYLNGFPHTSSSSASSLSSFNGVTMTYSQGMNSSSASVSSSYKSTIFQDGLRSGSSESAFRMTTAHASINTIEPKIRHFIMPPPPASAAHQHHIRSSQKPSYANYRNENGSGSGVTTTDQSE